MSLPLPVRVPLSSLVLVEKMSTATRSSSRNEKRPPDNAVQEAKRTRRRRNQASLGDSITPISSSRSPNPALPSTSTKELGSVSSQVHERLRAKLVNNRALVAANRDSDQDELHYIYIHIRLVRISGT